MTDLRRMPRPMSEEPAVSSGRVRASFVRGTGFLVLWVALIGVSPADLVVGLITAAAATWTSLRLAPPGAVRVRFPALPALAVRFAWQSVLAGWDVARRAFAPRLPLRPGFVAYPVKFAPGPARNAFAAMTSLLPGTVPCADENGKLVYHCLDVGQPVADELAAEETRLALALEAPRDA